jgi:hypothetical protein
LLETPFSALLYGNTGRTLLGWWRRWRFNNLWRRYVLLNRHDTSSNSYVGSCLESPPVLSEDFLFPIETVFQFWGCDHVEMSSTKGSLMGIDMSSTWR